MPRKSLSKTHILLKSCVNWADECDFYGFRFISFFEYNKWMEKLDGEGVFPRLFSFGTNQEITFYNKEEYLSSITTRRMTAADGRTIKRLFQKSEWGHFPDPLELMESE